MNDVSHFSAVTAGSLTPELWNGLTGGGIGILRISGFISAQRCSAAVERLTDERFPVYDPFDEFGGTDPLSHQQIRHDYLAGSDPDQPPVSRRLGRTLYEHAARGSECEYFTHAMDFDKQRRDVFADGGDVIDDVLTAARAVTGMAAELAEEPGHGKCFAGVIREVHGLSRLHSDDSREETPGFLVGAVPQQLGINVFLQMPEAGGALTVYDREYQLADRSMRSGYGLDPRAVAGDSYVGVTPQAGDLILFPARHIHRVDACSGAGRRIMLQAHVGITNEKIVCWS
ncbi:2OG-Fe(II)-dependent halogenase WelO5 family protein [Nocardia altamirensis]|uniref:2OG-Fe(II)-dependent halogenase WelO5 family protein n=1 Tax=Nocardia altamirensis TaxID=472158 RepID=UPI00114CDADE|nr:putative 2OG-Fe(II) oxygenase [Nocardia altamirensis]